MTATIIDLPSLRSMPDERAAEQDLANAVLAEIMHIAQRVQPDAEELDLHHAGCVWRGLRRAWHMAGEPGTFVAFVDTALATVADTSMA